MDGCLIWPEVYCPKEDAGEGGLLSVPGVLHVWQSVAADQQCGQSHWAGHGQQFP